MNPQTLDLSTMELVELQALIGYLNAQIIIANYQTQRSVKANTKQVESLTSQVAKIQTEIDSRG